MTEVFRPRRKSPAGRSGGVGVSVSGLFVLPFDADDASGDADPGGDREIEAVAILGQN